MAYTQLIALCRRLAVACVLLFGGTCVSAQQWHTTIEISHPAEITLPVHVSEVLLVNNTVAHPDVPMGAFFTLMAASEMLEGSDYLPSVLETSQNTSGSLYRKQLFTYTQADSLMSFYQSDAMLVLNQQIVHSSSECYLTDNETYYACMQAIAATHWTLFFRNVHGGEIRTRPLVYSDTLYWGNEAETAAEAARDLPPADEACSEMCIYAGERLAAKFMPTTETVDRYLYDVGRDDRGMYFFTRRQWQQAVEAWLVPQQSALLSAYAAANSAVAYEILGDLEAAYAAAGRALDTLDSLRSAEARQQAVNIRYYRQQLWERMAG